MESIYQQASLFSASGPPYLAAPTYAEQLPPPQSQYRPSAFRSSYPPQHGYGGDMPAPPAAAAQAPNSGSSHDYASSNWSTPSSSSPSYALPPPPTSAGGATGALYRRPGAYGAQPPPPAPHHHHHHPSTPAGYCPPHSTATTTQRPKLTTTVWEDEGTICYQVDAKNTCVARREDNDMVNGTKLLNVVGMSRGKRDGILKNEKGRVVVKVGAMHLKGVWITFARAKDLATKFKILDLLYPLFTDRPADFLSSSSSAATIGSANLDSASEDNSSSLKSLPPASHASSSMYKDHYGGSAAAAAAAAANNYSMWDHRQYQPLPSISNSHEQLNYRPPPQHQPHEPASASTCSPVPNSVAQDHNDYGEYDYKYDYSRAMRASSYLGYPQYEAKNTSDDPKMLMRPRHYYPHSPPPDAAAAAAVTAAEAPQQAQQQDPYLKNELHGPIGFKQERRESNNNGKKRSHDDDGEERAKRVKSG